MERGVENSYNAAGQLTTVTTPSGRSVTYSYANNRPVAVTVDAATVLQSAVYEPFGPIGGWSWGNSTQGAPNTHTRLFDKDFRVTRVTSDLPASSGQPAFDRQFSWDDASRIGSITDLANSALSASYGYDSLDRLTSASQGTSAWGYTYSGVGDRLTSTVNSATTNYGYSSGTHRLASLSGAQSKSYTFDAAGNMTSDGTTTWTYGGNNRPTAAGSTAFLNNALGQRVKKTTGSAAVRFVYDEAGKLWGEYDSSGTLIQETVWLEDLPVATIRPNGSNFDLFYVHADQLGTPRKVTRPSDNAVMWRWDNTEAFGNSAPNENPSGVGIFVFNLRFPGQYYDQETGKHYNYFRDYDSSIGRYLQSDPIGLRGGLNTFGYVNGDPIKTKDPKGLVRWGGKGKSLDLGPYGRDEFTLQPECKCGMQITITIEATYFGLGGGASAMGGDASYEDNFSCPNPMAFEGPAFKVSGGAAFRFGVGFNFSILGRATSPGGWSVQEGLGASAGVGFGSSKVTSQSVKKCDSPCP